MLASNGRIAGFFFRKKNRDMEKTPIKRHPALQPLSRDHHQGLLLSWKIREGFRRGVDVQRVWQYAVHFYRHELVPHFETEERYVFSILGDGHLLVKRALAEHRRLNRLFSEGGDPKRNLSLIEEELEAHIRFEERVLFQEIQDTASEEQLREAEAQHAQTVAYPAWEDEFWR